jgi:hypothetical protein
VAHATGVFLVVRYFSL